MAFAQVAAAVVLSLAWLLPRGCAVPPATSGRLNQAELQWAQRYGGWEEKTIAAAARGEEVRDRILAGEARPREYLRAVGAVLDCAERLREESGRPPSRRLERVERLALAACGEYVRGVRNEARAFSGDPGAHLMRAEAAWTRAERLSAEAERALDELFVWNRQLRPRAGRTGTSRIELRFSRAASALARRQIEVRCWSAREWPTVLREWRIFTDDPGVELEGFVPSFESRRLNLSPEVCGDLVTLVYGPARAREEGSKLDYAYAVGVLAHEIEHLVGRGSEAATECYGMQDIRALTRLLGRPASLGVTLAEAYWLELYAGNPSEYTSSECRNGGRLDRRPDTNVWP